MLNKKYQSQEVAIASYDYVDVEEGAGIVAYNLAKSATSAASTYFLTRQVLYSDTVYSFNTSTASTATKQLDLDFDIIFQSPKTMANATAYADFAIGMGTEITTGSSSIYAKVTLSKGAVTIGAVTQSRTFVRACGDFTAGQPDSTMITVPISTGAVTHFKVGDILKVNVEIWGLHSAGSSVDYAIGHDPKDRADPRGTGGAGQTAIFMADQSTTSTIRIPWRMDR